jgi:hypothetical protein
MPLQLLAVHGATLTDAGPEGAQRALEVRLNRLEQQNAVLMAENSELRRRVAELSARLERDEHMYATGRRVAEPPPP